MSAVLEDEATQELRIERFDQIVKRVGLCRSEITARIRRGEFPKPIPLGKRAVGFVAHEVDRYLANLIASRVER